MRKRILAFCFVFSSGLLGYTVSGQTSLTDLVNYTLEHSRDIKKSELQCKEADYIRKEAIGRGLPQVDASFSYSKMMLPEFSMPAGMGPTFVNMFEQYHLLNDGLTQAQKDETAANIDNMFSRIKLGDAMYTATGGITITQLIYSQSYWVGLKTTKKTQELYSILKTKNEEDVIAEVATGYYQTGSLMLQLQTIDKSIYNLKEIYRMSDASYKNDFVKESTVNRLKVAISNLEVTRQTIQNGITIQLNYLKALAGMPSDSVLTIDTIKIVDDFENKEVTMNFNIENVPSYQALLKQEDVYSQQVKLAWSKYFPTIAAFGKLNYSSYSFNTEIDKFSNMNTFGLSLSMPIFSSGVNYSKVKQAQVKQAQLKEDILKTKDLLTINYNNAYLEYQTSRDMLAAQKENKELAQKVFNQTSLLYKEGMASMADLLNVNSDFLQADNSLNQQILKCKTAEIKMMKASGNLKSIIR